MIRLARGACHRAGHSGRTRAHSAGIPKTRCFTSPFTLKRCDRARCWCFGWRRWRRRRYGIAVPMLFYAAPPGDLAQLLAVGHELPLRRRCRSAARLLARRDHVPRRRPVRRLCVVADLRDRGLLVRVHARPRNGRCNACRDGRAADGRHLRVRGADAGFRPADPRHGVMGSGAVVLLARGGGEAGSDIGTRSAAAAALLF